MPKIWKATIGIRPYRKMFRVQTLAGSLIDTAMSLRGNGLADNYFESIGFLPDRQGMAVSNEMLGTNLSVSNDNVQFTVSYYESGKQFDFHEFLRDFMVIWKGINAQLQVRDIRRIGFVAEHRLAKADASKSILDRLTRLNITGHPAKTQLRFETRTTHDNSRPDEGRSAFSNLICEIYDSVLDVDVPKEDHVNLNLDAQFYYAPLFNGDCEIELTKLFNKLYTPAAKDIFGQVRECGIDDDAKKQ